MPICYKFVNLVTASSKYQLSNGKIGLNLFYLLLLNNEIAWVTCHWQQLNGHNSHLHGPQVN